MILPVSKEKTTMFDLKTNPIAPRRIALAGASSRALAMYAEPVYRQFQHTSQIVGIFDINLTRARLISSRSGGAPVFNDFQEMLRQTSPDVVIVTTVDCYHHLYTIAALEAGCDVITEKPMTIDAEKVRTILATEKRTGRKVTVTFNYRLMPYITRAKELIRQGLIGEVLNVDFHWLLDTSHGADYFRRWHRRRENSGGLLVHKATHHFDLINWWIESDPQQVFAFGDRRFYGPTRAERSERCSACSYTHTCEFFVDYIHDPLMKALYFDAEHEDGYFRDRCVFADEIDIFDTMSLTVRYASRAMLSYSLVAHSPYEGWKAAINGSAGRLELETFESGPLSRGDSMNIRCFNRRDELVTYQIPVNVGGHGGGDERLQARLFSGEATPDPLGHMANSWAGAMSVLIGVAANRSIDTGQPVMIQDLLDDPFTTLARA